MRMSRCSVASGNSRENVTAYDAVYVALAEVLDAPLLTFDKRLAASPSHDASIELLAEGPSK